MANGTMDDHFINIGLDLEESEVDISTIATDTTSKVTKLSDERERMRRENEKIMWAETRRLILGVLAQFAIAKGMENHDATIADLEPIATSITRKGSIDNVSTRLLALQGEIRAGNTGKKQGEELGNLIADAIFSRKKDAKSIVKQKEDAIRAREAAECTNASQSVTEKAGLLEEAATLYARKWLLSRLQEGLRVLEPGNIGLEWVSELHDEYL
jgi:hypothetical protein